MKLLPFPRTWIALVVTWLVLNGTASLAQLLLGMLAATGGWAPC
jgi:multisubunit Na+/H+ antiporter MnhE subunit